MKDILLISLLLILCSFKPLTVCEVKNDAKKYCDLKEITVKGKITKSFSFFGVRYYELTDTIGNCDIWIKPKSVAPNTNTFVKVTGKLSEKMSYNNKRLLILEEK